MHFILKEDEVVYPDLQHWHLYLSEESGELDSLLKSAEAAGSFNFQGESLRIELQSFLKLFSQNFSLWDSAEAPLKPTLKLFFWSGLEFSKKQWPIPPFQRQQKLRSAKHAPARLRTHAKQSCLYFSQLLLHRMLLQKSGPLEELSTEPHTWLVITVSLWDTYIPF